VDSFEACTNELISFVRGVKRLGPAPTLSEAPALERPALILLFMLGEHGPTRPSALAEKIHIDLSTVSRQLASLEASGWVARERDQGDRRALLVRLSDEGRRVLDANLAARRAFLRELLTDWSEAERQEFARLLGRLNTTLDRHPATGICKEIT
jgi:DNA-binding MarR family transcriptional regulator